MVENLLVLTRADAHQLPVEIESVEISSLVRESWSPFEAMAHGKLLDVEWVGNHASIVQLDREKTTLVLKNLFENAVAHTEKSGWVRTTIVFQDSRMDVTIANNGCKLRPADVAHLFDRFWRGDQARSDAGSHCGLGMSLCKKMMAVLGGSIEAQIDGGVFSVKAIFRTSPGDVPGLVPQTLDTAGNRKRS